jgi:Arylsulfotransferase (ASST)
MLGRVETKRAVQWLCVACSVGLLVVRSGPPVARGVDLRAAQPAGSVWAYPSPGTKTASPATQISLRGDLSGGLASLRVVGTRSGRHAGRVVAHSDGNGASFLPARRFVAGERVTVTGIAVAGAKRRPYSFRIARFVANSPLNRRMGRTPAAGTMKLVTRRDLEPPAWNVRVARPGATPSEIFAGPKLLATRNGQNGVQILSAAGKILFWEPVPGAHLAADVRVQEYRGRPVMTYWQGLLGLGQGRGEGVIVDSSYRVVKRVRMGNGYGMDLHEFRLTPEGTALVMAYQAVRYDMRSVGGPRTGHVVDGVIQEIDLATGLVLFEWHSLGLVGLDESDWRRRPRVPWDYLHPNSVQRDGPDALIVSARHTNAVYRIGRATGMIDWRLGGKQSDFRLGRGASFARQHDAEVQADGALRIFDNSDRLGRRRTRVITLRLDRRAKRATLVRAADRPDRLFAGTQGNAALLPNGSLFVDWGSRGVVSEIDPSNRLLFDAALGAGWNSYRAYRADWIGAPRSRPKLAARVSGTGGSRVYASWNGATEVASWRVFAGPRGDALSPVGSTPWRDLETSMRVTSTGPFFAAQALDAAGRVLATSRTVRRRAVS